MSFITGSSFYVTKTRFQKNVNARPNKCDSYNQKFFKNQFYKLAILKFSKKFIPDLNFFCFQS